MGTLSQMRQRNSACSARGDPLDLAENLDHCLSHRFNLAEPCNRAMS